MFSLVLPEGVDVMFPDAATLEWQPIETAPRDGTQVLLFFPGLAAAIRIGGWEHTTHHVNGRLIFDDQRWHAGFSFTAPGQKRAEPSHWAALPEAPNA